MKEERKSLEFNTDILKGKRPFIIAGPCSAESPEQLQTIATKLANTGVVSVLRAGIWKPRTRPNSFEGVGKVGLQWLVDAGREAGLPVITEVANPQHVEAALKAGVDMLWIGARTTVNPFSVQEIADSLSGVNIPVWIKNPIHLDLDLWAGALERFLNAGIKQMGAIHRGFAYGNGSIYRNNPLWEVPIELKRLFPDLPIISDPSHIGGKRDLIQPLAQRALDLNMDGLMIEVHDNPDKALSDVKQQITPDEFANIQSKLIYKRNFSADAEFIHSLNDFRTEIDEIDEEIVYLLKKRLEVVNKIGDFKEKNNVTVFQLERWIEIIDSRSGLANKLDMNEAFISEIFKSIHKESIRLQSNFQHKKN
jgi:chorismate mutase